MSYRNYNLNLALRKSFDIQQIREKYYNLNILCFKDVNGNGTRDDNEPFLDNILIRIERDEIGQMEQLGQFVQAELMTNYDGIIEYSQIPAGSFKLTLIPMVNLIDLFPVYGYEQTFEITSDMQIQIPFVESYKVRGRIILKRDKFSSLGPIDIDNIKVTAESIDNGRKYSALTGDDGTYVLDIPQAGLYRLYVNNIFDKYFTLENDVFNLDFNGMKTFEVDFVFFENERKINFNGIDEALFPSFGTRQEDNLEAQNQESSKDSTQELLTPEIITEIQRYLSTQNFSTVSDNYDGITEEEWVRIENLIRKIHNEDEDSEVNVPSPLPNPVKLEVDEVNFTQVVDMYEDRLNAIDKQIQSLEQQLQATNNPGERERLQSQIDALQKQKELIDKKHDGAVDRLQNIRSELGATKKNTGQRNEASKAAEFSLNNGAYNNSTIPLDEQLPDGLIYRIQLGVYSHTVEPELFNGLYPLAGTTIAKGKYAYSTGIFYSYDQATEADKQIREKGISDAFVIAYYNGKKN